MTGTRVVTLSGPLFIQYARLSLLKVPQSAKSSSLWDLRPIAWASGSISISRFSTAQSNYQLFPSRWYCQAVSKPHRSTCLTRQFSISPSSSPPPLLLSFTLFLTLLSHNQELGLSPFFIKKKISYKPEYNVKLPGNSAEMCVLWLQCVAKVCSHFENEAPSSWVCFLIYSS